MVKLDVNRYLQRPGHCAVASSASLANYYNKDLDYEYAVDLSGATNEGLYTGEIGDLLNGLGFKKVKMVSCDYDYLDWSWEKLGKKKLIEELKKGRRRLSGEVRAINKTTTEFLERKKYNNSLVIDYDFKSHIKDAIDRGIPIIVTYNWTMFFKFVKYDMRNRENPYAGSVSYHAVVCHGYDDKGVYIIDSHHEYYKNSLAKYNKGHYHMPWEHLATCMHTGDVLIPEGYDPKLVIPL